MSFGQCAVVNAGDGDSSRDANQKNDGSFYGVKSERGPGAFQDTGEVNLLLPRFVRILVSFCHPLCSNAFFFFALHRQTNLAFFPPNNL